MENNKPVVAVYCRAARADKTIINIQKNLLSRFAEEMGFGNCLFYIDNGYSGSNLDRPAFSEMNKAMQAGKIRAVIVKDHARIARNFYIVGKWLDETAKLCIPVIVYNCPDNELQDKLRVSLAASFAEKTKRRFR